LSFLPQQRALANGGYLSCEQRSPEHQGTPENYELSCKPAAKVGK
jgi:hypothetical protein